MGSKEYKVPSKDYSLQYGALLPELMPELERILLEENPILGKTVEDFEKEFAAFTGTRFSVGLNSGTDALRLALRLLDIGPGQEVITQANTFIATVSAIVMAGAKPVLVDPDPESMNLSAEGVGSVLTKKTAAVIPVHLYGLLCPMTEIRETCDPAGVQIIEDAAQAHGSTSPSGKRAGALGRIGCFSFHPSKNLGAFGDGGMITTDQTGDVEKLTVLRNLGKTTKYDIGFVAPNTKLDTLQAAILRMKLKRLDAWNERRRAIAALYRAGLDGVGDLRLPLDPGDESHVYHLFVVRTPRRDDLRKFLKSNGVNAGLHYPVPPHLQKLDVDLGYKKGAFPVAEQCAKEVLSLPVAPELTDDQVRYVCEQIRKFFGA
ncbi:MAG: DegT/DnrJ/EryC1/StrS family aminotransferase [Planctomycetota bacterium]|jgi:dTDP-4-amino-4,6-dideoxygalactose transaminase